MYPIDAISIHTPLAGSDWLSEKGREAREISIHTPLAGSDDRLRIRQGIRQISIHTPLAGSDTRRRAKPSRRFYFNPHSPCGERHGRLR